MVDDPDVPLLIPISSTGNLGMILNTVTDAATWANLVGKPTSTVARFPSRHITLGPSEFPEGGWVLQHFIVLA